jgi:hypothetical protein
MGSALLWALEESLGVDFTPDVKGARVAVYEMLADAAIAKAYPGEATPVNERTRAPVPFLRKRKKGVKSQFHSSLHGGIRCRI